MDEYTETSLNSDSISEVSISDSSITEVDNSSSFDFSSLVEQQENFHNDYVVMSYTFSCFLGVIAALIVVLIYSRGFQSNAK